MLCTVDLSHDPFNVATKGNIRNACLSLLKWWGILVANCQRKTSHWPKMSTRRTTSWTITALVHIKCLKLPPHTTNSVNGTETAKTRCFNELFRCDIFFGVSLQRITNIFRSFMNAPANDQCAKSMYPQAFSYRNFSRITWNYCTPYEPSSKQMFCSVRAFVFCSFSITPLSLTYTHAFFLNW